jgi:hypothetical protein
MQIALLELHTIHPVRDWGGPPPPFTGSPLELPVILYSSSADL